MSSGGKHPTLTSDLRMHAHVAKCTCTHRECTDTHLKIEFSKGVTWRNCLTAQDSRSILVAGECGESRNHEHSGEDGGGFTGLLPSLLPFARGDYLLLGAASAHKSVQEDLQWHLWKLKSKLFAFPGSLAGGEPHEARASFLIIQPHRVRLHNTAFAAK